MLRLIRRSGMGVGVGHKHELHQSWSKLKQPCPALAFSSTGSNNLYRKVTSQSYRPYQYTAFEMGWLWGSSDDNNSSKSKDPVRDLDPDLRDFLKKEAPQKYESKTTPPPPPERTITKPVITEDQFEDDSNPKVPAQSLYQDGRYAHIWKNYKSLPEVEAEGKSDQERMMDVMESHRTRQAELGMAALESCAVEQMEVSECFRAGGWSAKTTMCRAENRRFDRCYTMQAVRYVCWVARRS
jgi:hypothetical protein